MRHKNETAAIPQLQFTGHRSLDKINFMEVIVALCDSLL